MKVPGAISNKEDVSCALWSGTLALSTNSSALIFQCENFDSFSKGLCF